MPMKLWMCNQTFYLVADRIKLFRTYFSDPAVRPYTEIDAHMRIAAGAAAIGRVSDGLIVGSNSTIKI